MTVCPEFVGDFLLGHHDVHVLLQPAELGVRLQAGSIQGHIVEEAGNVAGIAGLQQDGAARNQAGYLFIVGIASVGGKGAVERGEFPDGGIVRGRGVPCRPQFVHILAEPVLVGRQVDPRLLVFRADPPGDVFDRPGVFLGNRVEHDVGGVVHLHEPGIDFVLAVGAQSQSPFAEKKDFASPVGAVLSQVLGDGIQAGQEFHAAVGNQPASEHVLAALGVRVRQGIIVGGAFAVHPRVPRVPDAEDVGRSHAVDGFRIDRRVQNAGVGGDALVGSEFALELADGDFQGKAGLRPCLCGIQTLLRNTRLRRGHGQQADAEEGEQDHERDCRNQRKPRNSQTSPAGSEKSR